MYKVYILTAFLSLSVAGTNAQSLSKPNKELVYLDGKGVIRWSDTKKEIALYGANYCLPSACDYRAADYISADRKKMIDQDMAHFARMGFDALRLCLWGDFENSDAKGNLILNDHLNLLDYLIAKAKERGIYMLLSPIVTYSSQWPDVQYDTQSIRGSISATFKKDELGTNPEAIKAQCNYISQLLNHVNPYTRLALKDDQQIIFIEMINEPTHHSSDVNGSVKYINALVDAVRKVNCNKLVFHNVSQDFKINTAMGKSKIQGATFAWYPSGLTSQHELQGNFLPVVDEYSKEMLSPDLAKLGRIVYEFDSPDLINGYMYPAMARSFRRMGAQWASMFSYDMLATAPYNLGWQTHYFNMVYTPQKAVGAMISSEIMKNIPMFKDYGNYPTNTKFGNFEVNYGGDLAVMNTSDKFYYANSTQITPKDLTTLNKIAGFGSSKVINYEGRGIYFLDKLSSRTWRLEVYPDALAIRDPFEMQSPDKIVTRSISRSWPMEVWLPGLEENFKVLPVNQGNEYQTTANKNSFNIRPGVYILTSESQFSLATLPKKIGQIRMNEFESLPDQQLPTQVLSGSVTNFSAEKPIVITANVYSSTMPETVILYLRPANQRRFLPFSMKRKFGYTYETTVPERNTVLNSSTFSWCIVVKDKGGVINYPSESKITPADWNFSNCKTWEGRVLPINAPIKLYDPVTDLSKTVFTRVGDGIRTGIFKIVTSEKSAEDALHLELPSAYDNELEDYTFSIVVGSKIAPFKSQISKAKSLVISARGKNNRQEALITLVEDNGTSWSSKIFLSGEWEEIRIPIKNLVLSHGVMLPLSYPGRWKYWYETAEGRNIGGPVKVELDKVERLQFSMRQNHDHSLKISQTSFIEVSNVMLSFE
jgi:hypothetical protein